VQADATLPHSTAGGEHASRKNETLVRRKLVVSLLVAVPVGTIALAAAITYWPSDPPPPLPAPTAPVLPDLTMPALREFQGAVGEDSADEFVFFTASIANVGSGPFMIRAVRGSERGAWRVSQRFEEQDGSLSELETPGTMVWGGHGHDHWHIHVGASYRLYSLPDMTLRRKYEKVGYCFFDQESFDLALASAPQLPRFPKGTCDGFERLAVDMGLSTGWNDPYHWTLPDQRLNVSGLPDGEYRLVAKADPDGWFRESDEANNETWAELRLTTSTSPPTVDVVQMGPAARPG
jgi:hypothetical protein